MIDHYYNTIVIAIIDITFYAHILKTQDFSIILELPDLLPKIIFFFLFWLHLQHVKIPRLEIKSRMQLLLMSQLQQYWILDLLCWARDQACTSAVTKAIAEKMPDF